MAGELMQVKSKRRLRTPDVGSPYGMRQTQKVAWRDVHMAGDERLRYYVLAPNATDVNHIIKEPMSDPVWVVKAFKGLSGFLTNLMPEPHPNGDKEITDKSHLMKLNWQHVLRG